MAVVQSSYPERITAALEAGTVANLNGWEADTRIVETAAGIGFGKACGQGVADKGVVLGASAAAVFVGVSIRDVAKAAGDADKYLENENAAVLVKGDIWVVVGGNVVPGDNVTFNTTTGVLSSIAADGSNFAIAGARWMTTALSGGKAVLRLGGALPSA